MAVTSMAWRLRAMVVAAVAGSVLAAGAPALASWVSPGTGKATAQAGFWNFQLRWTTTTASSVGIARGGTFTSAVEVTDAAGNVVSNVGTGRTVALSASVGRLSTSSLTLPASGPAMTASFTYTASNSSNWTTDTLTASSSGYTGVSITFTKQ